MDKLEVYVKMCEMAGAIRDGWIPSDWDYVWCRRTRAVVVLSGYETDGGCYGHETPGDHIDYYTGSCDDLSQYNYKEWHIWLPRQDQLQEMLCDFDTCLSRIYWWKEGGVIRTTNDDDYYGYGSDDFTSMEQLWLAFVMKEKYGKVWDGTDWVVPI